MTKQSVLYFLGALSSNNYHKNRREQQRLDNERFEANMRAQSAKELEMQRQQHAEQLQQLTEGHKEFEEQTRKEREATRLVHENKLNEIHAEMEKTNRQKG